MCAFAKMLVLSKARDQNPELYHALQQPGYMTVTWPDVANYAEALKSNDPQLIMVDNTGLDGEAYAVCKELQNRHDTADLPLVVLSTEDDPVARVKAFEAGAMDYIPLPISTEEMGYRLRNLLRFRKLKDEIRLQNERMNETLTSLRVIQKEMRDSIKYARRIQSALLSDHDLLTRAFADAFVLYLPKNMVSGDFYYFHHDTENNRLIVAAGDCTGHGVPGSIISVIGITALTLLVEEKKLHQPSEILSALDSELQRLLNQNDSMTTQEDGMDICIGLYEPDSLRFTYASANRPVYTVRAGSQLETHDYEHYGAGGTHEKNKQFQNRVLELAQGDVLYLSSDGFADQFGEETGKKFSAKRLKEMLTEISPLEMIEQRVRLFSAFEDWRGDLEQTDDTMIIGLRV